MKEIINSLIEKLHKDEDLFLILLLKEKLNKPNDNKINLSNYSFSHTTMTLKKVLRKRIFDDDLYLQKLYKLTGNYNCDECKHHIEKSYQGYGRYSFLTTTYKGFNGDSDVCNSCMDRNQKILNLIKIKEDEIEEQINIVITDDIVKLKYILNTLKEKIRLFIYKSKN
jgi:hypothetical protein